MRLLDIYDVRRDAVARSMPAHARRPRAALLAAPTVPGDQPDEPVRPRPLGRVLDASRLQSLGRPGLGDGVRRATRRGRPDRLRQRASRIDRVPAGPVRRRPEPAHELDHRDQRLPDARRRPSRSSAGLHWSRLVALRGDRQPLRPRRCRRSGTIAVSAPRRSRHGPSRARRRLPRAARLGKRRAPAASRSRPTPATTLHRRELERFFYREPLVLRRPRGRDPEPGRLQAHRRRRALGDPGARRRTARSTSSRTSAPTAA